MRLWKKVRIIHKTEVTLEDMKRQLEEVGTDDFQDRIGEIDEALVLLQTIRENN